MHTLGLSNVKFHDNCTNLHSEKAYVRGNPRGFVTQVAKSVARLVN